MSVLSEVSSPSEGLPVVWVENISAGPGPTPSGSALSKKVDFECKELFLVRSSQLALLAKVDALQMAVPVSTCDTKPAFGKSPLSYLATFGSTK